HLSKTRRAGGLLRAQRRVLLRPNAVALERASHGPRRVLADADRVGGALEAARRNVPEIGGDQHIPTAQALQLRVDSRLAEQIDELERNAQRGGNLLALERGGGDIDRYHHVAAQLARLVDWQIV